MNSSNNSKFKNIDELKAITDPDPKTKADIQNYETAMETGVPTGAQIRDALKEINKFEGATGILSYNGNNEVTKNVTILHFFKGEQLAPYSIG